MEVGLMRAALFVSFAVCLVLTGIAHVTLPDEVAIHFGSGGRADSWAPKWLNTLLFVGLYTLISVLTIRANLARPPVLEEAWLWAALGLYLLVTVVWCVRLVRAFKVPESSRPHHPR
jgi:uncharacterized membrane protein